MSVWVCVWGGGGWRWGVCVLVRDSISQCVAGRTVILGSVSHRRWLSELSEMQVCSSPRCSFPCLYLQLFSPLSANIVLTMLSSEEAGRVNKSHQKDVLSYWKSERGKHCFIMSIGLLSSDKMCIHFKKCNDVCLCKVIINCNKNTHNHFAINSWYSNPVEWG